MLPLELLQTLACPACKGELVQNEEIQALYCRSCDRTYPVIDGIPVLLPARTDAAVPVKCGEP